MSRGEAERHAIEESLEDDEIVTAITQEHGPIIARASLSSEHFLVPSFQNARKDWGRWTCACGELLARVPSSEDAMREHLDRLDS